MSEDQKKRSAVHRSGMIVVSLALAGWFGTDAPTSAAQVSTASSEALLAQTQAPSQPAPAPQPPPNPTGSSAPVPAPPKATLPHDGTPATVLDGNQAEGILGKHVRSATGEDMGRIVDIVVDRDGHVRAAVIDFGGFLGVGSRQIAVDWSLVHVPPTGKLDSLIVDLTRDQLKLAPVYKAGEPIVVLGQSRQPPAQVSDAPAGAPKDHP